MKQLLCSILSLSFIFIFSSCLTQEPDLTLENNSLTSSIISQSSCLPVSDDSPELVLSANGNTLYVRRVDVQNCSFELALQVSNEGNTIHITEKNVSNKPLDNCNCNYQYSYQISGMLHGQYVLCIEGRDPVSFKFDNSLNKTF